MTGIYTYKFKVDPQQFRKALYFNTFARKRGQLALVLLAWIFGIVLLLVNLVGGVEMSSVMQLCDIVILASMPLLIFSCEHGYRNYRSSTQCDRERTVSLGRDWIKFRISGDPDSEKTEWHNVMAVFELSDMFIIYRDADLMVVLPKLVIKAEDLPRIRSFFSDNLGRGFRYQRPCALLLVG
jgi:hypothetical protein